jgi:hypothetical protein
MPIFQLLTKIYNKDGISRNFNNNANRKIKSLSYVLMLTNKKIQLSKMKQAQMKHHNHFKIR